MNWREKVDPSIKNYLEVQIKESSRYKEAYNEAKNKGEAQLWISIGILTKQIFDLNLKIKFLEKALKELNLRDKKKGNEEVKKVLDSLQKY